MGYKYKNLAFISDLWVNIEYGQVQWSLTGPRQEYKGEEVTKLTVQSIKESPLIFASDFLNDEG